jgi:hypothetical protein
MHENSKYFNRRPAYILLKNGMRFDGYSFGAAVDNDGELGTISATLPQIGALLISFSCLPISLPDRNDWLRRELDGPVLHVPDHGADISLDR